MIVFSIIAHSHRWYAGRQKSATTFSTHFCCLRNFLITSFHLFCFLSMFRSCSQHHCPWIFFLSCISSLRHTLHTVRFSSTCMRCQQCFFLWQLESRQHYLISLFVIFSFASVLGPHVIFFIPCDSLKVKVLHICKYLS